MYRPFVLLPFLLASCTMFAQVNYASTSYSTAPLFSTQVADFDRDGRPDVLFRSDDGIHLKRNTGGGVLGPDIVSAAALESTLLAADVNSDGWPDLLSAGSKLTVFLNNHTGTFRKGVSITPSGFISAVVAGDLNGDGKVDVVLGEGTKLQVFKGNGAGGFAAGQALGLSQNGRPIELTDVTGDGKLDLIVIESTKAVIWPGKGDGTFGLPTFINNPTGQPTAHPIDTLATGDFTNDGVPDIALAVDNHCPNDPNHLCGDNTAFIYRNNGKGAFTRVNSFHVSLDGATMKAGDLNGDEKADLIFSINGAETGTLDYVLGNGNGTFGADTQIDQVDNVAIRDLNLDSRNDLVATNSVFSFLTVDIAQSGALNCAPPGSANLSAKICAPSTATATSPVTVRASGNSPLGVRRVELWIDGKKVMQRLEDQIAAKVTLAAGTHRIAVVAIDKYVGAVTTAKNVTVH